MYEIQSRAIRTSFLMGVRMMHIRKMRMCVHKSRMLMTVCMRFTRRIFLAMRMLVMRIVEIMRSADIFTSKSKELYNYHHSFMFHLLVVWIIGRYSLHTNLLFSAVVIK